jgi:hypothetical protein
MRYPPPDQRWADWMMIDGDHDVVGERDGCAPDFGQQVGGLMHPGEGCLDGPKPLRPPERGGIAEGWSLRDCRRTRLRPWVCKERRAGRGPMSWGRRHSQWLTRPPSRSLCRRRREVTPPTWSLTPPHSHVFHIVPGAPRHGAWPAGSLGVRNRASAVVPAQKARGSAGPPSPSHGRNTFYGCPGAPFGRCAPAPPRLE